MMSLKEEFIPIANIAKVLDESRDWHTASKSLIYNRKLIVHEYEGVSTLIYLDGEDVIEVCRHYDLFNTSDNCKRLQDDTALILFTPEFCEKLHIDIQAELPKVLERELCSKTTILASSLLHMYWYMRMALKVYKDQKKEHKEVLVCILK